MDKTQLVTIAVTAVVSVIAKELVTWLAGLVKTLSVTKTIKEKVSKVFAKNNRVIIGDLLWLMLLCASLVFNIREITPITRLEIALIVGLILGIVFQATVLLAHLAKWRVEAELKRSALTPSSPDTAERN